MTEERNRRPLKNEALQPVGLDADANRRISELWREQSGDQSLFAQTSKEDDSDNRYRELRERHLANALDVRELWEYANRTDEREGSESAIPLYRQILSADPAFGPALYALGYSLFHNGSMDDAAPILRLALSKAPEYTAAATELLIDYHMLQGEEHEAERLAGLLARYEKDRDEAIHERESIWENDRFDSHELDDRRKKALCAQLDPYRNELSAAYLVRKEVSHRPERPLYILVLDIKANWLLANPEASDMLVRDIKRSVKLEGDSKVFILKDNPALKKILKKIKNAKIYEE